MAGLTVHAAILGSARRHPGAVAVEADDATLTYGELDARSARLAGALRGRLGLQRGDRVAVVLPNCPGYYVVVAAVARAGLVLVPVPARATPNELAHVVADCDAAALILGDEEAQRHADSDVVTAGTRPVALPWSRELWGPLTVERLIAEAGAPRGDEPVDERDPFFLGYTSGTTGRPKAAVVSHRARTLLMFLFAQEYGCYTARDVGLIATPMYHGAGLSRALTPLAFGGRVVLHRRFDAARVAEVLAAGQITSVFVVPAMLATLRDLDARRATHPFTMMSNASALPEHLKHDALDRWPAVRLFEIYGSTESGTVTSLRPEDQLRKPRCVGQPLALTEVTVRAADGTAAPTGEVGELHVRSPYLFDGYFGRADATAAALRRGEYATADLARVDDEGYVHIVGRTGDVIISGGVNVYPREVEEAIREHPAVADVVVVGLPDDRWGEAVHAVVVPAGTTVPDQQALESHCRKLLAPQKIPKGFSVRDRLPQTALGKVRRDAVVADVLARSGPGAATPAQNGTTAGRSGEGTP